jgi:PIN domain nuclease of toxin-antitoxin system
VNLLLDTHVWVWALLEPERLSPKVTEVLGAAGTHRWLSPLSVWETLTLIERGRVEVDRPAEQWVRDALSQAPVTEAPVTTEVAFAARALRSRHRDPVDRFLAATAQVFDLILVTSDAQLLAIAGVKTLSNRTRRPRDTRR